MSLFLKVQTKSRLLGSSDDDIVYIAVNQIHKIQETGGDNGCVISHGNPVEKTVSDTNIKDLLKTSVVDLSLYVM